MKTKGLIFFTVLAMLLGGAQARATEPGDDPNPKAQGHPGTPSVTGHDSSGNDHTTDPHSPKPATLRHGDHQALSESIPSDIGIDEKLGTFVPLDVPFVDESGQTVRLRELIDKPTVVSFVYYSCTDVCPILLSGVADVLGKVDAEPGVEYAALTVSFDEFDTPADAVKKKAEYLKATGRPYPAEAWRFLTGDQASIRQLADAVGFTFQRKGDIFLHPVSIFVLSPKGKVVRYLYGNTFLPFDLKMALLEATEGRIGPTITKVLKYCFTYDPKGRKYVFNILRVFATTMVVFLAGLFIFLVRTGKRRIRKEGKG